MTLEELIAKLPRPVHEIIRVSPGVADRQRGYMLVFFSSGEVGVWDKEFYLETDLPYIGRAWLAARLLDHVCDIRKLLA